MQIYLYVCLAAMSAAVGHAQLSFDAATVKQNMSGVGGNKVGMTPESLTLNNMTLRICLKLAYDLQDSQIAGPDSIDSVRYDIVARAAAPASDQQQVKLMLQGLLKERFHLAVHKENRDQSVYAMVLGKNGPKFQKSVGEGRAMLSGKGTVVAQWAPMKALADFLSGPMRMRVVDMTGLDGVYDFKFDLMAYLPPDLTPGQDPDVAVMVLSGLEPALGLKLESRKLPVEMLVIDHVEKPIEN